MAIKHIKGDLFSAPAGSVLLHACNCYGSWGGGIAAVFRRKYPDAYDFYHRHCVAQTDKKKLLGTALLIPTRSGAGDYLVGCLFTSLGGGATNCDDVAEILAATKASLSDLKRQLDAMPADQRPPLAGCKFNSGIFNVPWEQTEQVIERSELSMDIYSP